MIDPIAVVDIDGVLADFSIAFTQRLVEMGAVDKAVPCAEQPTWEWDVPGSVLAELWAQINASSSFWLRVPPLVTTDDVHAMHELAKRARIVYMTGRPRGNRAAAQTKQWLSWYGLPVSELVMQVKKAAGVAALGGTAVGIIEDKPSELEALRDARLPVTAITRPYNSGVINVQRVATVSEWATQVLEGP